MGERLGEILVRRGLIEPRALEDALASQVLLGARLGTNLVEHGAIELDPLTEGLAERSGLPPALEHHFQRADSSLQARLSPRLAATWKAVPLGAIEGERVAVAVTDPLTGAGARELATRLGGEILQAIGPELRILYELEKRYGLRRPNRFLRAPSGQHPTAQPERRRYVEPIDSSSAAEGAAIGRVQVQRVAVAPPSSESAAGQPPASELESFHDALKAIRRATGRERVGEVALAAVRRAFGDALTAAVLFVIREDLACGWRGFCRAGDDVTEELAVTLTQPSILSRAYQRGPQVGPAPPEPTPIDRTLWALLGDAPASVAVAPIEVAGKTASLVYAHSADPQALTALAGHRLSELAQAMSAALEFLIRAAER